MKYYSVNNYIEDTFGRKLYKIAINAGFSCPNRDGTLGRGGCIFCDGGSGDFAGDVKETISGQIEGGKTLILNKMTGAVKNISQDCGGRIRRANGSCGNDGSENDCGGNFIAYFQAYTNTYAPVEILRKYYFEAINHPDIAALSIATRPDCISDEVLELLKECNSVKPTWVELGLQTSNEKTAEYIRRGYSLDVYDDAVRRLNKIGIPQVITHVIVGLPGEDIKVMEETVRHAISVGTSGIKLQLLHVLKDTDLAKDYANGKFEILSLEEYGDIIIDLLGQIPKNVVIHRITGDGNKRRLVAPLWSGDKKKVLNYLNKRINDEL